MATLIKHSDLRRFPRVGFRGPVILFLGKESQTCEGVEVSEGGILSRSSLRLMIGDVLTVHFKINESSLRARGEVIYICPPLPDGQLQVGIRFQNLFEHYREVIRNLANSLVQTTPEKSETKS